MLIVANTTNGHLYDSLLNSLCFHAITSGLTLVVVSEYLRLYDFVFAVWSSVY